MLFKKIKWKITIFTSIYDWCSKSTTADFKALDLPNLNHLLKKNEKKKREKPLSKNKIQREIFSV